MNEAKAITICVVVACVSIASIIIILDRQAKDRDVKMASLGYQKTSLVGQGMTYWQKAP